MTRTALRALPVVLTLLLPAGGQDPKPVPIEVRILDVLRDNGTISEAQHRDLTDYAASLRRDEAARDEAALAARRDLDALVEAIDRAEVTSGHRVGQGFRFTTHDERFRLRIGGRIQFRYTGAFVDEDEASRDEDQHDFDVRRARLWFEGHAFERWVGFEVQIDVAGDRAETEVEFLNIVDDFDSRNSLAALQTAAVDIGPWRAFRARAGQFKVPYSRQALTSSGELLFVDRAVTDSVFAPGRDIGLMLHGRLLGEEDDLFEYAAGVFDGEGRNRTNDDKGLLWAGRIVVNPLGDPGDEEGDWRRRSGVRVSVGLNAWLHQDDQHRDEGDDRSVGIDLAARWRGLSLAAEVHRLRVERPSGDDPAATGWFVQVAYALIDRKLELGVRTSHVDWDDNGDRASARREHLLVANWYLDDHDFKIQSDFGWVESHRGDHDDRDGWRWRVQLQLTF